MNRMENVTIYGKWRDGTPLQRRCVVLPQGLTAMQEDALVSWLLDDESIFFVFNYYEDIVGEHIDFIVNSYEREGTLQ